MLTSCLFFILLHDEKISLWLLPFVYVCRYLSPATLLLWLWLQTKLPLLYINLYKKLVNCNIFISKQQLSLFVSFAFLYLKQSIPLSNLNSFLACFFLDLLYNYQALSSSNAKTSSIDYPSPLPFQVTYIPLIVVSTNHNLHGTFKHRCSINHLISHHLSCLYI